jgi:flagellar protein FliS
MPTKDPKDTYLADAVMTATPAQLVTMLYDRLAFGLAKAKRAIVAKDVPEAHLWLTHCQRVVALLRSSLRLDLWEGAADLRRIYDFLLSELVAANLYKDLSRVENCERVVEPLASAWHEAARRCDGQVQAKAS